MTTNRQITTELRSKLLHRELDKARRLGINVQYPPIVAGSPAGWSVDGTIVDTAADVKRAIKGWRQRQKAARDGSKHEHYLDTIDVSRADCVMQAGAGARLCVLCECGLHGFVEVRPQELNELNLLVEWEEITS